MALTDQQISKFRMSALATKHNCSFEYVRLVLMGRRETKSEKAKAILADAKRILKIVEEKSL